MTGVVACVKCGGPVIVDTAYGETDDYLADGSGPYCTECYSEVACPVCGGTGETQTMREYCDTCPACKGTGKAQRED